MPRKITKDEIINDLRRVADELDTDNPTMDDYREHGEYSIDTVLDRFDKWNKAKTVAGLDVNERNVSDERLLVGLREMYNELDRAPTEDEMDEMGPFSSTTYQRKFGSWLTALRFADELIPEFEYNPSEHTPAAKAIPT